MMDQGTTTFSASIGKELAFTGKLKLRYEADFSNLFNFENFANPQTQITSGSLGQISAVQTGEQAGPRTIQMSLRLAFYALTSLMMESGAEPRRQVRARRPFVSGVADPYNRDVFPGRSQTP